MYMASNATTPSQKPNSHTPLAPAQLSSSPTKERAEEVAEGNDTKRNGDEYDEDGDEEDESEDNEEGEGDDLSDEEPSKEALETATATRASIEQFYKNFFKSVKERENR
jgi:hypothetical protein